MKYSLIIPIAPGRKAEILKSIKELNYSKDDLEIISITGTNPSINRNLGSLKSKGQILIFLDDDAILDKEYLNVLDNFLIRNKEIDIVGGVQLTPKGSGYFERSSGYALASLFGAWKLSKRYSSKSEELDSSETSITSANLVCKKEVMNKIEFDKDLFPGEDPKFILDAKKNNFKVAYNPKLIIYHKRRESISKLIKQIFLYGKVRPKLESFSSTLRKPFFFIPSLFAIYFSYIIVNRFLFRFNLLIYFPLILYIILGIIFSFYESVKNKDLSSIFILPFIFLTIHLSYGVGIIYGNLEKVVNNNEN